MPIQLNEENGGKILVVHVDMTGLHGWDAGAAWEDLKFDIKHFGDVDVSRWSGIRNGSRG